MTLVRCTIEVPATPERAFDHVADFATTAEWDPGIALARRIDLAAPVGVGSRFEVVAVINGKELPLEYRITVYERPARVVLVGEGARFRGVDDIRFSPSSGGTTIDYEADLSLRGLAVVVQPFMRVRFEALGTAAMDGLRATLSR